MAWTEKHIKQLANEGKIRSFAMPAENKQPVKLPAEANNKHSKALAWLKWNLWYWSNEHTVKLEEEYRFCQERQWRFDFAIPSLKIAVEYEGGIFMKASGHNTAKHYTKDADKYNRAAVLGWRVIRATALNYQSVLQQLNEVIK